MGHYKKKHIIQSLILGILQMGFMLYLLSFFVSYPGLFEAFYVPHPSVSVTPAYRAIFEDNDPLGRIIALANHNSDLAEYWEYFAQGYFPVDPTNDAFRLGMNYFIYGLTY